MPDLCHLFEAQIKMQKSGAIKIDEKALRKAEVYSLHEVTAEGKKWFGKVLYQEKLTKRNLMQSIQFNNEVLETCSEFIYPEHFLRIHKVYPHSGGIMFLTERYEHRLDEYLRNHILTESQAMLLIQQILKAVYSLMMAGYWSRNFRAEHFVSVSGVWKIESLVFSEQKDPEDSSEYSFSHLHQVPEAYEDRSFTDEQMEEWVVWDLGCLLIHMLTGNHKLKSKKILDQFKGKEFGFKEIGVKADLGLSEPFKKILGNMCHHNPERRMRIGDLIKGGFFSKEVALHFSKNEGGQSKKIFLSGSSSVSQMIAYKDKNPGGTGIGDTQRIMKERENEAAAYEKKIKEASSEISNDNKFMNQMKDIMEEVEEEFSFKPHPEPKEQERLSQIQEGAFAPIISLYKNYLDKCTLIGIGADSFEKMLNQFSDINYGRNLLHLTQFALSFVKSMDLHALSKAMNLNSNFFNLNAEMEEKFLGSKEHRTLKKLVSHRSVSSLEETEALRQQLLKQKNSLANQSEPVRMMAHSANPQECTFDQIKLPYRTIVKKSYDMIVEHYSRNKTQEWASVGMYITFCMAIDKLYISEEFKDNFKFFFEWAGLEPSHYVSLQKFQEYLQGAPKGLLVQNSRYIIEKFYQL